MTFNAKSMAAGISAAFLAVSTPAAAHQDRAVVMVPDPIEANIKWFERTIATHNHQSLQYAFAEQNLVNRHNPQGANQIYLCAYKEYTTKIAHSGVMALYNYNYATYYTLHTYGEAAREMLDGCANLNSPAAVKTVVDDVDAHNAYIAKLMRYDHANTKQAKIRYQY